MLSENRKYRPCMLLVVSEDVSELSVSEFSLVESSFDDALEYSGEDGDLAVLDS